MQNLNTLQKNLVSWDLQMGFNSAFKGLMRDKIRWDNHNTKPANGILFFNGNGSYPSVLSYGQESSRGMVEFVRDSMSYTILSWWCDDNCFECACLYLG